MDPQETMCCSKPSIQSMDYTMYRDEGGGLTLWNETGDYPLVKMVNKVCLNCFEHWAGPEDAVVRYSKKSWGKQVEEVFAR